MLRFDLILQWSRREANCLMQCLLYIILRMHPCGGVPPNVLPERVGQGSDA